MELFLVTLLGIVWLDLLLSGDNAVVIALVSGQLPPSQQKYGLIGGVVAAIALRIVMSFFAAFLLGMPVLSILGGLYLLWVAAKLLISEEDEAGEGKPVVSLWAAVATIGLADASMSLDNVMALAALSHGQVLLMVLGVVLSIPLVIAGAAVISMVIGRFPILTWAGAGLLGWVAGGIIAADPWAQPYLYPLATSAFGAVLVLWVGASKRVVEGLTEAIARSIFK